MRGHLRERSKGVWELVVPLGRDPVTGQYRRVSRSVRGTKREAQHALATLVSEVTSGRETGSNATVADLMDQWLALAQDDLSPTTARRYRSIVDSTIVPALGSVRVRKLQTDQLDALYRGLSKQRGLSPSSVRQVHAVLRRALRQAVRWGWISANPAVNASPPRIKRPSIEPPSIDEMLALIAEADRLSPDFGAFLRLTAATGLRRGEACALRWNDIDLEASVMVISRSVVCDHGRELLEKDTKTHAARRLALDRDTVGVLREHLLRHQKVARACGLELPSNAFVFSERPDGSRPWYPDTATARFEVVRERVGLDRVRLHDVRHLHATQLLAAGVPVRTVSGRLGHADASTTLNVYAHFLEASDREAASVMGALRGGKSPTRRRPPRRR
jgi:integrase